MAARIDQREIAPRAGRGDQRETARAHTKNSLNPHLKRDLHRRFGRGLRITLHRINHQNAGLHRLALQCRTTDLGIPHTAIRIDRPLQRNTSRTHAMRTTLKIVTLLRIRKLFLDNRFHRTNVNRSFHRTRFQYHSGRRKGWLFLHIRLRCRFHRIQIPKRSPPLRRHRRTFPRRLNRLAIFPCGRMLRLKACFLQRTIHGFPKIRARRPVGLFLHLSHEFIPYRIKLCLNLFILLPVLNHRTNKRKQTKKYKAKQNETDMPKNSAFLFCPHRLTCPHIPNPLLPPAPQAHGRRTTRFCPQATYYSIRHRFQTCPSYNDLTPKHHSPPHPITDKTESPSEPSTDPRSAQDRTIAYINRVYTDQLLAFPASSFPRLTEKSDHPTRSPT